VGQLRGEGEGRAAAFSAGFSSLDVSGAAKISVGAELPVLSGGPGRPDCGGCPDCGD